MLLFVPRRRREERQISQIVSRRNDWLVTPVIKTSNHYDAVAVAVPLVGPSSRRVRVARSHVVEGRAGPDGALCRPSCSNPQASPDRSAARRNYKTELCKHWNAWAGNPQAGQFRCPYGDKCNFAHGEMDLAWFSNAEEMHANGMIEDPDTYLCLPCFDFVATGACPMGSRCNSLHDPSIVGSNPAWLELFTKPKRKSLCVIPDGLYYHRDISRFQTNPVVGYHAWKLFGRADAFRASYDLVCNVGVPIFDTCFARSPDRSSKLDEVQRLCIVKVMQKKEDSSGYDFVYSNKYWLNGQACMVLQTRYFRLLALPPKDAAAALEIGGIVGEISEAEYDCNRRDMIRADEVVFESKGRYNCNRSIWFDANIQREHAGGRGAKRQDHNDLWHVDGKALFCMPKNLMFELSLPAIAPHVLMQPKDDCEEGYELIDAILEHRIGSLLASRGYRYHRTNDAAALEADFSRLSKIAEKWAWPPLAKEQVAAIFEKTREEHTKSEYAPLAVSDKEAATLLAIWGSLVTSLNNEEPRQKKRLDVFVAVSSKDAKFKHPLPHITNSPAKFVSRNSEDTWKDLLLGEEGAWTKAKLESDAKRNEVDFDARSPMKARTLSS